MGSFLVLGDVDSVEGVESLFCGSDGSDSGSEGILNRFPEIRKGVMQGILSISILPVSTSINERN